MFVYFAIAVVAFTLGFLTGGMFAGVRRGEEAATEMFASGSGTANED